MFIYNITIKVDKDIHDAWLEWQKKEHIPDLMNTGCFTHVVILRLLEVDESEGFTYVVQCHAPGRALYNRYIENFSTDLRKKSLDKWGHKFIAFRTIMEVVN